MALKDLCDAIRGEIVSRDFPPGMKLSEPMLCKRWNVSRTPIREALRHLESEGFINSNRNKGFVVTSISLRDVEEAYTIMINLDSLAGRLATPLIVNDPEKIEELRRLCEDMRALAKKKDVDNYIRANGEFHSLIFRASENVWLIRILENIHAHTNRFILKTLYIPRRIDKSTQEHDKIFKCIENRDAERAGKAIATHFTKAFADLEDEISTSDQAWSNEISAAGHAWSMGKPQPHPRFPRQLVGQGPGGQTVFGGDGQAVLPALGLGRENRKTLAIDTEIGGSGTVRG
ncbi:MAG: GntR family transcriptional regulator [Deltaproteobacteria bacterium]|nr:GntR family transcriptional regulator [Deltaproteobacteria bacterium]